MAEDTDLIAALDELETSKGPQPLTCMWWASVDDSTREAVIRNVRRTNHSIVTRKLRELKIRVTNDGIRDHVAGNCSKCQTS